jgi:hypothetical protein
MSMNGAIQSCAAALVVALAAGAAAAKPALHPARTPAEQTLARILKLDADNPEAVDPAIGHAGRRPRATPPPGAPYLKYETLPLATAILAEEAHDVKANCGGVYKADEECGMDADPILCAQDYPQTYLFRTTRSDPDLAVIETAWPGENGAPPEPGTTYRLKLTAGVWKIDGIACVGGGGYNWAPR